MPEEKIYPVDETTRQRSHLDKASFLELYQQSIENPDEFWAEQAGKFIHWYAPWTRVVESDFPTAKTTWFKDGKLNVCFNCVDRHLERRADQTAIIWEGDEPDTDKKISYRDLHRQVCKLANALKSRGVKKGDRVCIYMPMVPEAAYAMLASARLGAIHSVVFGGFSPETLKDRILDSDCRTVITADEGLRGGRIVSLKQNVDAALESCPNVSSVFVVRRTNGEIPWHDHRDVCYHKSTDAASDECAAEPMDAEDPLFILYTSGSTGKPKGVLHTTAGYLLGAAITHKYVFDYHEGDIYWCTADVGWVTGHSYIVYGPLCNGAITLMFEGVPTYPDTSRFWQVVDKHQVNIFYTAPTAIRALMSGGDEPVKKTSRASLRLLGSVGEPILPEAWEWYYNVIGDQRCPIV
ncbi:MAG: AMP-binding protein, partial [Gammaproteobacteria bacterium]